MIFCKVGRVLAAGLACCCLAGAAAAAAAEPVPVEAFFRRPSVLEHALSPSGRRLAITTAARDRVGLFVFDLQSAELKMTRAALFNDVDVNDFAWVDDERLVFDVVDLQAGSGQDYLFTPGLFAARYDGEQVRALADREPRPFITDGSRRSEALPWNHELLLVPTPAEETAAGGSGEVIVGEWVFGGRELRRIVPKRLDTRSGRVQELALDHPPEDVVHWWFSPDGLPRAALTRRKGQEALHWYHRPKDGAPGRWELLAEGPQGRLPLRPVWVGSGEQLYVEHFEGPAGLRVVAPYDFAQRRPGRTLVVVPGFDFQGQLLGRRDGEGLLGVRADAETEVTVWLDPVRKALQQRVDEALPGRVNRLSCRRCGSPDAVAVVQSWSDRDPGRLLLWRPGAEEGKGRWRVISTLRPGIDPQRMGSVRLERIRARDGRELPVWLTLPAEGGDGPRPAVVLVHGGPWVRHGHWRWDPMAQFLASRGYVVIEPEFRGSDGYGQAHLQAGFRQWGQAMQDDVADALLWAQAQKIASDRACIAGGSYGGYSTLMGLVRHPALYRCGSAWSAVADLMLYVDGGWFVTDDISRSTREYSLPELVGDAERDRAMLLANSPVEQAARITAPLQLIWGNEDRRVPLSHGKRLRSALQAAGREPEWIVYDGEAHGLRQVENQVDMARKLEAFLARHLK